MAEEIVIIALQQLADDEAEHQAAVTDLQKSIDDEQVGRIKPLSQIAADFRREHGFSDSA